MDVIGEVKKLNFPLGKFVVVGSGPMAVRGLKVANDVDIVVTPDLFRELTESDEWEKKAWTYPDHPEGVYLRKGAVEVYLDVNCGSFCPTTEELIARAELIGGVPFTTLKDCMQFKRAYGREKHLKDIELIERYLNNPEK